MMAISLNSVVSLNSTANYQHVSKGTSVHKALQFTCPSQKLWSRKDVKEAKWNFNLLVANTDQVGTDISNNNSVSTGIVNSSVENPSSSESSGTETEDQPSTQQSDASSGLLNSKKLKEKTSSDMTKSAMKRTPLTAREKLRAARVLSRYNEPKPKASKPEISKLLEVLRESEKGKEGLPEAPSDLLDDSKRGMPKAGLTFEFPGGSAAFLIAVSFVTISTIMFATTYIVWKVGAIHFNE